MNYDVINRFYLFWATQYIINQIYSSIGIKPKQIKSYL